MHFLKLILFLFGFLFVCESGGGVVEAVISSSLSLDGRSNDVYQIEIECFKFMLFSLFTFQNGRG